MSIPINKIHVNSSTRISLNDRFTVIQSVAPVTNQTTSTTQNQTALLRNSPANGGRRKRSNSSTRGLNNLDNKNAVIPKQASFANRKFLEQLEKKHKMQTALKLKRRSLKATMPPAFRRRGSIGQGQRVNTMNGYRSGRNRGGGISGRFMRSNSFANIATMKADLMSAPVAGRLKRSNSTSSLAARLGAVRRNSASQNLRRLKIRRGNNNNVRNENQLPIVRGRSRSRQRFLPRSNSISNLTRSNSRTNLRRTNSRTNLNVIGAVNMTPVPQRRGRSRSISRNRQQNAKMPTANMRGGRGGRGGIRGNGNYRSASRPRYNAQLNPSVHSRLGVKRLPITNKRNNLGRLNNQNIRGKQTTGVRGGRRIAQGRIVKRKNSTVMANQNNSTGVRQGRSRGRGNSVSQTRTRSQSRGRNNSVARAASGGQRGNRRGRSRGRGGRGTGRGINRSSGKKTEVKREDLDQELDQYMAATKSSSDNDF